LPQEHNLPEKRELFREKWRDFCGFYKKTLRWLLLKGIHTQNSVLEMMEHHSRCILTSQAHTSFQGYA
jgi:hypothetical protein